MSFDLKIQRGDLVLDSSGQLNIVERNDKLVQDIIKVLLTDLGENKFHPYYGSSTGKLDIGSVLDQDFFKTKIEDGVIQAINNLIALQKNQSTVTLSIERSWDVPVKDLIRKLLTDKLDKFLLKNIFIWELDGK